MQLKKLQLLGFKTFADKTEIELDTGLTAIVGPNGSGKSNLVDALLWVLGEQNPRLLRGNNAQDVIFAGTDKRKALGMAEVKLTVDNSDGTLPINFAEVTITRRIYRSGESQYLLNGATCRLKDIVELFMDTGVGKGAYSFVSQSEIDAVLSARPEDRRELFEEAAGIKKYRVKKREALRKLESAETNLNRVRDILHELDGQREPMERQAQAARRFLGLQDRLHEIEVGLLVSELKRADYELYAGRNEREDDQTQLLAVEAELARLERLAEEVGQRLAQAEGEMEAVRVSQQNALSAVERTESRLTLMIERGRSAALSQEQLAEELKELAERIARLTDSITIDREDRDAAEVDETARRHEWAARQAAFTELEAAVSAGLREIEARQGERLRLAQERAGREAALQAAEDRLQDMAIRAERLAAEAGALAESLAAAQTQRERTLEARDAQRTQHAARVEARGRVETQAREAQTEQSRTRAALDVSRRQLAEQSSRLATLTEMQENHEGFYQGVRAVLNAVRQRQLSGHYRAVVDLLTVPERYRVAIEVALGGSLQDIVTETEAEAKAGIEWLKRNRAGRATFLPLPLLRPGQRFDPGQSREASGIEGVASDLIEFDAPYVPVAQLLLGRVLVVADMDAGIAASRRLSGWSKIVTLEGELLTPGGALTGGSLQGRGVHLVGRKGEMDDLKAQLPVTRGESERLAAQAETLAQRLMELEAERSRLAREEAALQAQLAAMESAIGAADREFARMEQERINRQNMQNTLATQIAALEAERQKLTGLLAVGREQNDTADDALASLNAETRDLIARRDDCRSSAVALEVEVGRLREKREGLTRTLAADRAALTSLEQQRDLKLSQRSSAAAAGTEAEGERERLMAQREEARGHLAQVEAEFTQWRDRRQALLAESFANNNAIKEAMERRAAITKNLHATELRLARLEIQVAQATERLRDEYNIDREEALARPDDVAVDKNTAIEVGRLRRELRGMGQVNIGAVAEYERLTERYEFLNGQRADLEQGRESLLATIAEIDESTRGVFMETFEAVRTEFDRLFTRLFEGGSTKLLLTHPEDLLETGIEVIAQPPGKKPQSLSLLSGGERALTATALLFAFLAVKPSPFVLLDEVDAPLDGANVEKYTRLVHEFSERSQFLLITHNPVTMEAAPTWYGVTMKEPGISSVLSYRVPQESEVSAPETAVVLAN